MGSHAEAVARLLDAALRLVGLGVGLDVRGLVDLQRRVREAEAPYQRAGFGFGLGVGLGFGLGVGVGVGVGAAAGLRHRPRDVLGAHEAVGAQQEAPRRVDACLGRAVDAPG